MLLHQSTTALALAVTALASTARTSNFIGLPSSVPAGSLPESAPFHLVNCAWTQLSIADGDLNWLLASSTAAPGT